MANEKRSSECTLLYNHSECSSSTRENDMTSHTQIRLIKKNLKTKQSRSSGPPQFRICSTRTHIQGKKIKIKWYRYIIHKYHLLHSIIYEYINQKCWFVRLLTQLFFILMKLEMGKKSFYSLEDTERRSLCLYAIIELDSVILKRQTWSFLWRFYVRISWR